MSFMLHRQRGTPGSPKPMIGSNIPFSRMVWNRTFVILSSNVMCVNATRKKRSNLRAHYNLFRFRLLFWWISLWILLQAYPNREINQSSWWLFISFPSILISVLFNTHLLCSFPYICVFFYIYIFYISSFISFHKIIQIKNFDIKS